MDKDKIDILKQNIENSIRQSAESLYLDILKTIEVTLNEDVIVKEPDESDTVTDPEDPKKLTAIEIAQQNEKYEQAKAESIPELPDNMPTGPDDISNMKLLNSNGVNEDTKGNKQSLLGLKLSQQKSIKKQTQPRFPTIEEKKNHILRIVDHEYARQVPINNESFKKSVLKYGLMKDEEYEETMLAFTVDGMARATNGDSWFFMNGSIPKVEKSEDNTVPSPISGITPKQVVTDDDDVDDDDDTIYPDDYDEESDHEDYDEEDDGPDDGEITGTDDDTEDDQPVIKW